MTVFAYDPVNAKNWADNIVNYLNGGQESVSSCSKKFSEQIEKLVQPNVWTGAAAAKNYQNFMETHNALINFINSFGVAFQDAMNSVNKTVADLEIANLGDDTNVTSTFGSLSYDKIAELSEQNINKEIVKYDYATIIEIGDVLNQIDKTLENVNVNLKSKINELNNGSSTWDGEAAESAKINLDNILTENMNKVFQSLNVCISNIKEAAAAAQHADSV